MNFHGSEPPLNPNYGYNPMMDPQMKHAFPMNNSIKKDNGPSSAFNETGHPHPMQTGYPPAYPPMDPNQQAKMQQSQGNEVYPVYERSVNYYHEFWRMYLQNEVLISQMKEYVVKTKEIQARISQLEAHCHELELNILSNMKKETIKKKRRKATEIEKKFTCPYDGCHRPYGSDVSLNLHIKLKHSGGNKTEREKLARMIIEAKLKNQDLPEISLNLPPGFLEGLNIHKILKLKDKKEIENAANSEDPLKDINLSNADLTNLLSELDKAIEGDRSKGGEDFEKSQKSGPNENGEDSPTSSVNN